MQRAPSTESNSVLKRSPSLMAATAVLPLLTPTERRALQLTPAERSAFESFPHSSSSSTPSAPSSGVTSIRDLTPRTSDNAIHDPNWQVFTNLPYSAARSQAGSNNTHNALAKATRDLIALQPQQHQQHQHHSSPSDYRASSRDSLDIGNSQTLASSSGTAANALNGGVKPPGRSVRSNSSGSVGGMTMLGNTGANGVGTHHHRPIAPAPPMGVSKGSRSSTNSSPPAAKRPRRSHSPLLRQQQQQQQQQIVGISNSNNALSSSSTTAYGSPSTSGAVASSSSAPLLSVSGSPLTSPQGGTTSPPSSSSKATLLTPQQKKANHIQSEQKRRANIRRGYEALCETIPALREAIRAEEDMSHSQSNNNNGLVGGGISNNKKRRSREESGEKVDGRAGPRSESVVLHKTIEHIQGLLYERETLLSRLERAYASLSPSHPALKNTDSIPRAWEREWDGGKGLMVVNGEVIHGSDEE